PAILTLSLHDALLIYPAAALLNKRRVADELDRVAETLFRIEQDRSTFQGRPVPARLAKRAGRGLLPLPAPFILGPAALVVAGLQDRKSTRLNSSHGSN